MTRKGKIKIIKKKKLKVVKKETKAKQEVGREVFVNVSNWVNDFQKRKRGGTKHAIEQLFPARPQIDGV